MICEPCKKQDHPNCPAVQLGIDENRPSAALSPEGMRVQLSGLCPCQHRVPDFRAMVEKANAQLRAAGFSPPILEKAK